MKKLTKQEAHELLGRYVAAVVRGYPAALSPRYRSLERAARAARSVLGDRAARILWEQAVDEEMDSLAETFLPTGWDRIAPKAVKRAA